MERKRQLTKTSFLILFVILISAGVTSAYAINITLGGTVDITQILNMMGNRITNVGTPTQSSDAATKGYVDSAPSTDTLALLGCSDDEIPKWDGSQWICSKDFQTWNSRVPTKNTITTVDSGTNVGLFTSITIGSDNLPVISYHDTINDDLKIAKCNDPACTTSTKTVVDSTGNVGGFTSIAIGTDGNPVVSYYDFTNQDLKFLKCGNLACSSGNTIRTLDSGGIVGEYTSITIQTDGNPLVSYYDRTNGDLKATFCNNSSCSSPTIKTISSVNNRGWFSSVAISATGFPVFSMWDSSVPNLRTFACSDELCTSGSTNEQDFNTGTDLSMTVSRDGYPIISHRDSANSDLLVTKCGTQSCGGLDSVTTTVDSSGDVGTYTSIAIGLDGLPVISYYDIDNSSLKVAKCFSDDCSVSLKSQIDQDGNVGRESSIAIGPDGLPVISYRDFTNGNLKVAKCGSPSCNENWTRR